MKIDRRNMDWQTECVHPPIPIRDYDWQATLQSYEPGDPVGYGRTEQDAIDDLCDQLSEEQ